MGAVASHAGDDMADWIEQLERLTQLHKSGALTDGEFALQKAKLLAAQDAPQTPPVTPAPVTDWHAAHAVPERGGALPKAVVFGVPAALVLVLAAWFGSTLVKPGPDEHLTDNPTGAATDAVVATATPTQEAPLPVALDGTLRYAAADQCKAGPVLEAIYSKLDAAMDLGSGKGVTVKLDAWDVPLGVWAKSVTDQTGSTTQDAAMKFPAATTWHGLRLSRITAQRLSPAGSDSSYTRSISFLEPADKVQKTLAKLGFGAPREPDYVPLSDEACGGSARVVSLNGGAALTCSWGC